MSNYSPLGKVIRKETLRHIDVKDVDSSVGDYLAMMLGLEKKTVIRRLSDDMWVHYQLKQLVGIFEQANGTNAIKTQINSELEQAAKK